MTDYYQRLKKTLVERDSLGKKTLSAAEIGKATDTPYFGEGRTHLSVSDREEINAALKKLEAEGLISLHPVKDRYVTVFRAELVHECIRKLYEKAGISDRSEMENRIRSALDAVVMQNRTPVIDEYISCIYDRPFCRTSVWSKTRDFGQQEIQDGIDVLKGVNAVLDVGLRGDTVLVRNLSAPLYGDSKRFTALAGRINTLLYRLSTEEIRASFEEAQSNREGRTLFEMYGVVKNPFEVPLEGNASIACPRGLVETQGLPYYFQSDRETAYTGIQIHDRRLVTIENRTTYFDFKEEGTAKMYTGGFPAPFLRRLLMLIARDNPSLPIQHWSDIDVGGFRIFDVLDRSVPGRIEPYRMDEETIIGCGERTKQLTESDRQRLSAYRQHPLFSSVAAYMLEHNVKVEQENEKLN